MDLLSLRTAHRVNRSRAAVEPGALHPQDRLQALRAAVLRPAHR